MLPSSLTVLQNLGSSSLFDLVFFVFLETPHLQVPVDYYGMVYANDPGVRGQPASLSKLMPSI